MACMRNGFEQGVILNRRFKTLAPLNKGSFGMVFSAQDLHTNSTVAIKCLTKNLEDATGPEMKFDHQSDELPLHAHIGSHPNIVNLISSFETASHSYLVLEFCPNGDLYEAIRAARGPLETEHVRDFMLQLVTAVEYVHSKGVYHRDIKPENIFLSQSGSVKLGDFGLATRDQLCTEYGVGSDRYMAPEQFDPLPGGQGYSPAAADVWSIGVCLLNVLFGRNPFATPTHKDPLYADFVRDRQSLFDVFPTMSQDTFDVLMHALILDPSKRSLSAVRDALKRVVSFTTDDEALDDFCNSNDLDLPGATINREPLRTPSVSSPQVDNNSFPWSKGAQATPHKAMAHLATIQDEDDDDDIFPLADVEGHDPTYKPYEADTASLASALDSGIAMSYKSLAGSSGKADMVMASSLPTSRAMAAIYGNDDDTFSKSWCDLWDEDEEMKRRSFESVEQPDVDDGNDMADQTRSSTPAIDIVSRGSSTPRAGPEEAPPSLRARLTNQVRQMAGSVPQGPHTHKRSGSSLMDKWAALGNMRRKNVCEPRSAVDKTNGFGEFGRFQLNDNKKATETWRKGVQQPVMNESWNRSTDWRSARPSTGDGSSQTQLQHDKCPFMRTSPRVQAVAGADDKNDKNDDIDDNDSDDVGDLEWVGVWQDLQL